MTRNVLTACLLFAAAVAGPAGAEEAVQGSAAGISPIPAETFAIIDTPFECRDFRGQKVVVQQTSGLGDVARARILFRISYIQLDPERMARLPPKMQMFFFGHECAHHALGHNFYPATTVEVDADCWSIIYGRDKGFFTREEVAGFRRYIEHSKGSAFGHLPGPERADHLLKCFDGTATFAQR